MNARVTRIRIFFSHELQDDNAFANSSATKDELRFVVAGFHGAKQSRDAVEDLLDEFVLGGVHGDSEVLVFHTVLRERLDINPQILPIFIGSSG